AQKNRTCSAARRHYDSDAVVDVRPCQKGESRAHSNRECSHRLRIDHRYVAAEGTAMYLRSRHETLHRTRFFAAILIAFVLVPALQAKTSTISGIIFTLGSDKVQTV